jgi:hypothetical protein
MMETTAPKQQANGLATYFSVIWAPKAAFEQLARTPMWGWACIMGMILLIAATIISMPEQLRIAEIAQQHAISQMTADQQALAQQRISSMQGAMPGFAIGGALFGCWLIWLISAVLYWLSALIGRGDARFGRAWVAALNVGCVFFVVAVVNAIILRGRGVDSITGPLDAYTLPSLGMLAQNANIKLATFLSFLNIGSIWGYIIAGVSLVYLLKIKPGTAIVCTIVIALIGAGLTAAFAR